MKTIIDCQPHSLNIGASKREKKQDNNSLQIFIKARILFPQLCFFVFFVPSGPLVGRIRIIEEGLDDIIDNLLLNV